MTVSVVVVLWRLGTVIMIGLMILFYLWILMRFFVLDIMRRGERGVRGSAGHAAAGGGRRGAGPVRLSFWKTYVEQKTFQRLASAASHPRHASTVLLFSNVDAAPSSSSPAISRG
jgi:hypothetical protein